MFKKNRGILSGVKCWFALLSDMDPELSPKDDRMGTPNPTHAPKPIAPVTRKAATHRVYANAESVAAVR